MAIGTQRHQGRDSRPHTGGILCLTELDPAPVQPRQTERPPSTLVCLPVTCFFLVAVETLGTMAEEGHGFVREIGRRATLSTADPRETAFLYQRISVAVQLFNSVCLANSFPISESSG